MQLDQLAKFGSQTLRMHMQSSHRVPLSMHIVLTNRCNLQCTYCCTHDLPQKDVWTTDSLKDGYYRNERMRHATHSFYRRGTHATP